MRQVFLQVSTKPFSNAFDTSFVSFKTYFNFLLSMSLNQEEDILYHVKLNAQLRKEHKKMLDAARATWKKPNCQTNIDCPVATDMVPGDQPKNKREEEEEEEKSVA
jgi:hypothetical protein